jgi:hypothetical protein
MSFLRYRKILLNMLNVFDFTPLQYASLYFSLYLLCGLVVRVLDYRPRGTGSIPGPTRFSEK